MPTRGEIPVASLPKSNAAAHTNDHEFLEFNGMHAVTIGFFLLALLALLRWLCEKNKAQPHSMTPSTTITVALQLQPTSRSQAQNQSLSMLNRLTALENGIVPLHRPQAPPPTDNTAKLATRLETILETSFEASSIDSDYESGSGSHTQAR